MKRMGIEGIYLGGWATSAKGSIAEDPGPDLASYPLSQVPGRGRRLGARTPDRRQESALHALRMTEDQRKATPSRRLSAVHHRRRRHRSRRRRARAQPDPPLCRGRSARLSHRGSEARRQEVRPPGRQSSCGRRRADQAPQRCPLPARHHAGARHHRGAHRRRGRHLLESRSDERDQPFILGATNIDLPSYKAGYLAILRKLYELRRRRGQRSPAVCHVRGRIRGGRTIGSSASGLMLDRRRSATSSQGYVEQPSSMQPSTRSTRVTWKPGSRKRA